MIQQRDGYQRITIFWQGKERFIIDAFPHKIAPDDVQKVHDDCQAAFKAGARNEPPPNTEPSDWLHHINAAYDCGRCFAPPATSG